MNNTEDDPLSSMEVEDLSDQLKLDFEDVYQQMLDKEKRRERLQLSDTYLSYRQVLVEWMTEIGENILGLHALTIHLAVAYLDKTISRTQVHPSRLQLVSVACILAAAKHEEVETKVPSVHDLNKCCKDTFTATVICKMEVFILNQLDWELMLITPRHFLETYVGRGAISIYPDDLLTGQQVPFDKHLQLEGYLRKYAEFFVDFCLHDHSFCNYVPSLVASSALAAARRKLQVTPSWPKRLRKLSGYSAIEITSCLESMWNAFQTLFAEESG